ncbi:MAG: nitrite reductase [Bacteroidetes bacterium]|jgi:formate-dependent nitrite reductase membrane component NrfD|nr:nitrite reductase [Bacteroidota bacterium]
MEEQIITGKLNPHIDPVLAVWEWQIPVYLFLGGLTAGLLILGAISVLRRESSPTVLKLQVAVPVILAVGMFALFLDLAYKVHVFRFYTAFEPTAPMSWGSWILLLVVPANLLLIAGTMHQAWPRAYDWVQGRNWGERLTAFAERRLRPVAWGGIVMGVALGIYTGILLSAYGARPFWNTSILGPIFLVSGLSSAAALTQWVSRSEREQARYTRLDVGLILVEVALLGLMLIGMVSGPLQQQRAADLVLGGELTVFFWVFVVMLGLLLPVFLEVIHLRGKHFPRFLAPAFILAGGLIFRFFIVEAGQLTTWIPY